MEDKQLNGKPVKMSITYTVGFIIIISLFGYVSAVALIGRSTELKDVYTAFCALLGGLIAGLITMAGVTQTVRSNKELESRKLIPQKLVKLYELNRELEFFQELKNQSKKWLDILETYNFNNTAEIVPEDFIRCIDCYGEMKEFTFEILSNKEYTFIKLASEVDIEVYNTINKTFADLRKSFENLLNKNELPNFYVHSTTENKVVLLAELLSAYFEEKIEQGRTKGEKVKLLKFINEDKNLTYKTLVNKILKCEDPLREIYLELPESIENLKVLIEQKSKEYGREML
ncbi:hypothetical protein [Priestia megaterium]|uniref:hypothetical protein n=1 Tax=Priestia megaterium TaxID=1404 RepID=UPI000CA2C308|nr:hypothetical protein [Priestia megaterium]AUO12326.1 hypothetical protein C0569_13900 [Priestia megaterium]